MKWFYEFYPEKTGIKDDHRGEPAISYGYYADKVLFSKNSKYQKVEVIHNKLYGNILFLDELMMTNELDEFIYHETLTHIPASSFKGSIKNVLVIGGGDGGIVREVLRYPTVEAVDLVEIDKMVIDVSKKYLKGIACELENPKLTIYNEDASLFVKNTHKHYDLILVDSTDPIGPGLALYTEDFYTNSRNLLTENGQFAVQGLAMFVQGREQKKMYHKLKKVFPYVKPYFATIPTYPTALWMFFHANSIGINVGSLELKISESQLKFINNKLLNSVYSIPSFAERNLKIEKSI